MTQGDIRDAVRMAEGLGDRFGRMADEAHPLIRTVGWEVEDRSASSSHSQVGVVENVERENQKSELKECLGKFLAEFGLGIHELPKGNREPPVAKVKAVPKANSSPSKASPPAVDYMRMSEGDPTLREGLIQEGALPPSAGARMVGVVGSPPPPPGEKGPRGVSPPAAPERKENRKFPEFIPEPVAVNSVTVDSGSLASRELIGPSAGAIRREGMKGPKLPPPSLLPTTGQPVNAGPSSKGGG